MKITTAAEMREIDRATTEQFGVPSLTLMENAGSAVAQFILQNYAGPNRVIVICGKGHESYQIVGSEKRPFDDRVVAHGALFDRAHANAVAARAGRKS